MHGIWSLMHRLRWIWRQRLSIGHSGKTLTCRFGVQLEEHQSMDPEGPPDNVSCAKAVSGYPCRNTQRMHTFRPRHAAQARSRRFHLDRYPLVISLWPRDLSALKRAGGSIAPSIAPSVVAAVPLQPAALEAGDVGGRSAGISLPDCLWSARNGVLSV